MSRLRKASRRIFTIDDHDSDLYSSVEDFPLDEQEQEELIHRLRSDNEQNNEFFKIAFITIFLLPSPVLITLPYCRRNPIASLFSLLSLIASSYSIYFDNDSLGNEQSRKNKTKILKFSNLGVALTILIAKLFEHWPWKGYDYIWCLPLISSLTSIFISHLMHDSDDVIHDLNNLKYKYKGA